MRNKIQVFSAALLGTCVAFILWTTILGREKTMSKPLAYLTFKAMPYYLKDLQRKGLRGNFLGNILLFTPAAFFWTMSLGWKNSWKTVILLGFFFSLAIELIQYFTVKGVLDISDILLNVIGTTVGWFIGKKVRKKLADTVPM